MCIEKLTWNEHEILLKNVTHLKITSCGQMCRGQIRVQLGKKHMNPYLYIHSALIKKMPGQEFSS